MLSKWFRLQLIPGFDCYERYDAQRMEEMTKHLVFHCPHVTSLGWTRGSATDGKPIHNDWGASWKRSIA